MATKKEFVLQVTQALQESPRAILAGHKIPGGILQRLVGRPDILAKLAAALYSTKYARRGAKGLRKSKDLWIKAYKNFPEFNAKARLDVEAFIEQLDEKNQNSFSNNDSILTIIALPDSLDNNVDTLESDVISGKSIAIGFETAVKKEYKIPGGFYVIVMIADSAVRPAEANLAKRKEKINSKKQKRRTPACVKAELKNKAAKKIAKIEAEAAALSQKKFALQNQISQLQAIGKQQLGIKRGLSGTYGNRLQAGMQKATNSVGNLKTSVEAILALIPSAAKEDVVTAIKLAKRGKKQAARALIKGVVLKPEYKVVIDQAINNPESFVNVDTKLNARKNQIKNQIVVLSAKNEELLVEIATAEPGRKNSIRSILSRNNKQIKALRAKLGTYKNISAEGYKTKAKMLRQVNKEIEANLAAGVSIKESLNAAIAALDATQEQKQIVKQQVIQLVADNVPLQYAAQQAVQNLPEETFEITDSDIDAQNGLGDDELNTAVLNGSKSLADILASL